MTDLKSFEKMHQLSLVHLLSGMAEKLWWVNPSKARVGVTGMHCKVRVHGWGSLAPKGTYKHRRWSSARCYIT